MGNLPFEILQWTLALAGVWLISGTLLNFSSHPHWYIRGWDFPRVLTAGLALMVAAAWAWTCAECVVGAEAGKKIAAFASA
jgi:hypothetical protein